VTAQPPLTKDDSPGLLRRKLATDVGRWIVIQLERLNSYRGGV
jgi:hypothetical protein